MLDLLQMSYEELVFFGTIWLLAALIVSPFFLALLKNSWPPEEDKPRIRTRYYADGKMQTYRWNDTDRRWE